MMLNNTTIIERSVFITTGLTAALSANILHIHETAVSKAEELFEFLKSLLPYISSSKGCESCELLRRVTSRFNVSQTLMRTPNLCHCPIRTDKSNEQTQ